jgi:hypothetical protein
MNFTDVPFQPVRRRPTFPSPGLTAEQEGLLLEFEEFVDTAVEHVQRCEKLKRARAYAKTGIRNRGAHRS